MVRVFLVLAVIVAVVLVGVPQEQASATEHCEPITILPDFDHPYGTYEDEFGTVFAGPAVKQAGPSGAWLIGVLGGSVNDHNIDAICKNHPF